MNGRGRGIGEVLLGRLPEVPAVSLQPGPAGSAALAADTHPAAVTVSALAPDGKTRWAWRHDEGAAIGLERDEPRLVRAPGGWYLVWMGNVTMGRRWEAQFLSEDGKPAWPAPSRIGLLSTMETSFAACAGSDGSLFVAWTDNDRSAGSRFLVVAKVLRDGSVAWSKELGRQEKGWLLGPALSPDLAGGAYLAFRHMDRGVMVHSFSTLGEPRWPEGLDLFDQGGYKTAPAMTADGAGGAIVLWEDGRNGTMDVYAQRVSERGPLWKPEGVPVAKEDGNQWTPQAAPDGQGGAYALWIDDNKGSRWQVELQRLDSEGRLQLPLSGLVVSQSSEKQYKPMLAADGSGGAFVGWLENGYGQFQLLGQRFGASGKRAWSETGAKAVDSAPFKDEPQIAPDGQGGLFFAWRSPEGAAWDVRAARLDARGRPAW